MDDQNSNKKNEFKAFVDEMTTAEWIIIGILAVLFGRTVMIPIALYVGSIFLFSKGLSYIYQKARKEEAKRTPYFFFNISNLSCIIVLALICIWELTSTGGDLNGIFTAMIVGFVLPINLALFMTSAWMKRSKKLRKPLIAMISLVSVITVEIIIAVLVQ